jgi:hypothetical protein
MFKMEKWIAIAVWVYAVSTVVGIGLSIWWLKAFKSVFKHEDSCSSSKKDED